MHADDAQVVQALLAKNEAAYVTLVKRLHPRLVAIARRIVVDDAAAEDVAQETWRRVLRSLPTFTGDARLDTWITQIAVNRAKTRREKQQRDVPLSSFAADDDKDPLEGAFNAIGRWRASPSASQGLAWTPPSPEDRAGLSELRARVDAALQQLPEQQRLIVTMRDVEGASADEAAAVAGVSAANERVLLHRGRTRIRQLLTAV